MGPVAAGLLTKLGVSAGSKLIGEAVDWLSGPSEQEKAFKDYYGQVQKMARGETTPPQQDYLRQIRERYQAKGRQQATQTGKSFARRGIGRSPAAASAVSQVKSLAGMKGQQAAERQRAQWQTQALGQMPQMINSLGKMQAQEQEKKAKLTEGLTNLLTADPERFKAISGWMQGLFNGGSAGGNGNDVLGMLGDLGAGISDGGGMSALQSAAGVSDIVRNLGNTKPASGGGMSALQDAAGVSDIVGSLGNTQPSYQGGTTTPSASAQSLQPTPANGGGMSALQDTVGASKIVRDSGGAPSTSGGGSVRDQIDVIASGGRASGASPSTAEQANMGYAQGGMANLGSRKDIFNSFVEEFGSPYAEPQTAVPGEDFAGPLSPVEADRSERADIFEKRANNVFTQGVQAIRTNPDKAENVIGAISDYLRIDFERANSILQALMKGDITEYKTPTYDNPNSVDHYPPLY